MSGARLAAAATLATACALRAPPAHAGRPESAPVARGASKQERRQRLLLPDGDRPARITQYGGRGPLGGWLRVASARLAVNLPLELHRQIKTTHKITVIMVQLIVTVPGNPEGLKPGTTVNVAYAQASVN